MRKAAMAAWTALMLTAMLQSSTAFSLKSSGAIRGLVTDPSGARIPNAEVTLAGPGVTERLLTDQKGEYQVTHLAPGHYSLRVKADGFASSRRGLVVAVNRQSEADVPLAIQPLRQSITVMAVPR